ARARHADLIVNTTPLGRRGEMTIRPNFLPPRGAVIDLVYMAGGTPLVRRSRQLGLRCADGWGILVAQGAAAFQAWTGQPAPVVRSVWVTVLLHVAFFDFEHRLVLDRVLAPAAALAILASLLLTGAGPGWQSSLVAGVGAGAVFAVAALFGRFVFKAEVMGM